VRPDRFVAFRHPTRVDDPVFVLASAFEQILGRRAPAPVAVG